MSHDQNFKNLILDYPRAALAFFAETEALDLPNMRYAPARRIEVYAQAVRGLAALEADPESGSSTWITSTSTPI